VNATDTHARPLEPSSSPRVSIVHESVAAIAAWCVLVAVAAGWGAVLLARGANFSSLDAPPLTGHLRPHAGPWLALPAGLAVLAIWLLPRAAVRIRWKSLLVLMPSAAFVWAMSLALAGGAHALVRPLLSSSDYLHDLGRVGNPVSFLHHFVRDIGSYTTHVRAHPPGMLLVLWSLRRAGLAGAWPAAFLVIASGAASVSAVLVSIREVAGEQAARRGAPFLAIAPAAIWIATSADALFAGVSAWGVALVILASGRTGARARAYALAGGVLFGAALMLSYGLVPLAAVPLAVALRRGRAGLLVLSAAGMFAVLGLFWALGFSWVAGLLAARREYNAYITRLRPYDYFLLANVAAFAIALGPAITRGLSSLRDRGIWLLVAGALVAVAAADLSGLSKGEVERIWLPFVPWVLAATAAIQVRARRWLAAQAIVALAITLLVRSPW